MGQITLIPQIRPIVPIGFQVLPQGVLGHLQGHMGHWRWEVQQKRSSLIAVQERQGLVQHHVRRVVFTRERRPWVFALRHLAPTLRWCVAWIIQHQRFPVLPERWGIVIVSSLLTHETNKRVKTLSQWPALIPWRPDPPLAKGTGGIASRLENTPKGQGVVAQGLLTLLQHMQWTRPWGVSANLCVPGVQAR